MNLLLTHGYFLAEDPKEQEIMKPYPPLGILSITAYLRKQGIIPLVYDTTFSTFEEFRKYLLEHRPKFIGIYTNLMTKLRVLDILRFVRNTQELTETKIFLGGPEVTYHVESFLAEGADAVVIGEGEETTHELLNAWQGGASLHDVTGLAFIDGQGNIVRNPPRPLLKAVDSLPFPARDAINLEAYIHTWREHHGRSAVSINTMRGCPYTCRWCSRAVYGSSYRRRSPALVAEEIELIASHYNPDTLWFVDDVFTISPKWLRGFTKEVQERNITMPYECITRADRLDEEMVDLLVKSGCYRVWIGAESGSQRIIDAMDRRVTVERVQEMILLCKKRGIETGTFIMIGYPGETEQDIIETIEHLKACQPDHYTITTAYPITGTPLFNEVQERLTVQPEWSSSTDRDLDFERTYPKCYYRHALRRLHNEVELHKLQTQGGNLLSRMEYAAKAAAARIGMAWTRKESSTTGLAGHSNP